MVWVSGIVALGLVITALALARIRQPSKTNVLKLPNFAVSDRAIAVFAGVAFTLAFVNMLVVIAVKTLQ